jgi:hypothetical protein
MKVMKLVTTTYEIDLINDPLTPANVAKAIDALKAAGVDMENATFVPGDRAKTFKTVSQKVTWYDDSTLKRMEK